MSSVDRDLVIELLNEFNIKHFNKGAQLTWVYTPNKYFEKLSPMEYMSRYGLYKTRDIIKELANK